MNSKNIKIGIITYHNAYNYGSMLQAYALNFFLRRQGFDVQTIDYRPQSQDRNRKLFEPVKSGMSLARNLHSLWYLRSGCRKRARFDTFFREEVPSSPRFRTREELQKQRLAYDWFVCGSDQIWNQNCRGFDTSYLLDFVGDKKNCIAYAASTGGIPLSAYQEQQLQHFILDYKAISMRETSGCLVVKKTVDRVVPPVLDPTCLLAREDWEALLPKHGNVPSRPYIFCYFIGHVPGMRQWAQVLREKTGYELVVVNRSLRDIGLHARVRYDAGPREWLELLKNASYVCTDSFHAMVFSLIFQKKFWVFVKPEQFADSGTRVRHLGALLGCEERILADGHPAEAWDAPLDFPAIERRFHVEMEKSGQWLLKSLEGER